MPDDSAATLKDVYDLVDRSRQETTGQITSLAEKFDAFAQSNEHRLTIVETHQAAQAQQLTEVVSRLDKHGLDLGALKDQRRADEVAAKLRDGRWSKSNAIIVTVSSLTLAIGTILMVVYLP